MKYIDIFNGDADGIFALIQWRKAYPISASDEQVLITGVKRDINLLSNVDDELAKDAVITVFDVSFDKNTADVQRVLEHCQSLFYCDHHKADSLFENDLFNHEKLTTHINTEPTACTGLLINGTLKNQYPLWAITALFGDGLDKIADGHLASLNRSLSEKGEAQISEKQRSQLKELGVLVNYNGYGSEVADLHFAPAELYQLLMKYDTPFAVIEDNNSPYATLKAGYEADIAKARVSNQLENVSVIATILDNQPWARRISGTYGNQLAADNPDKPVVVATMNTHGSYTISLRAPKNNLYGASTICSQFATGGGREGAAGVNELPLNQLEKFVQVVSEYYQS